MKALFVLLASCALFFGSARPAAAQFVFSFGGGPCYPSYGGYYSDYYGYYPGYYPSYYGYGWSGYYRPWWRHRYYGGYYGGWRGTAGAAEVGGMAAADAAGMAADGAGMVTIDLKSSPATFWG